jgi:diol dehydratase reactivase alpha subunit
MEWVAGVDVGNNSTEIALGRLTEGGAVEIVSSAMVRTVGIKGTSRNAVGVIEGLDLALGRARMTRRDLNLVLLNEATPVIGDVAMETITEMVITESAMIGHNPSTPGGAGLGLGTTIALDHLLGTPPDGPWIVVIPGPVEFRDAARQLNEAASRNLHVAGAIVQKDDGVLIHNRLHQPIPIVDEVHYIDRVPLGMPAAVEVALQGKAIDKLSNPYDIATLFNLDPDETRGIVPVARALTGTRSAVVIKTPKGDIQERRIPAGTITLTGQQRNTEVKVEEGAEAIMQGVDSVSPLVEIQGEPGTNVGGMFENVRNVMAELTDQPAEGIQVRDILAVDTLKPQQVLGGLAGEYSLGNAVGLAAMVETHKLPMQRLARKLEAEIEVPSCVGGVEAEMAIKGALTTPGTRAPLAILDLGGGSTDASTINELGQIRSVHLAGAGDMVTMLIDTELGLEDRDLAELVKRHPLAKVETLFHLRHEDGSVQFFGQPLDPRLFGRIVVISDDGPVPIPTRQPLPAIAGARTGAKHKVFVQNALRALRIVAPAGNIRLLGYVVMVGGSALDFEIPKMISDALIDYGVVTGRANVRGLEGARNAVATGLVLVYAELNAPGRAEARHAAV